MTSENLQYVHTCLHKLVSKHPTKSRTQHAVVWPHSGSWAAEPEHPRGPFPIERSWCFSHWAQPPSRHILMSCIGVPPPLGGDQVNTNNGQSSSRLDARSIDLRQNAMFTSYTKISSATTRRIIFEALLKFLVFYYDFILEYSPGGQ